MPDNMISFERDKWSGAVKASPVVNTFGLALGGGPLTTTDEAYQTVPWLYRAAQLRAATLSRVPYCLTDTESGEEIDDEDPRVKNVMRWMSRTLYLCELSRVLYGAAYFLIESNRFGLNTTPRYAPYQYVQPMTDQVEGLKSFRVAFLNPPDVPLNRMVYVWEPCTTSEIAHGPAPAYVALMAAGMLGALDAMGTQYFRAGAVPITAVEVPPTVSKDEREKLEGFFARFWSGIRNAFKFVAVNQGTKFQQIGANMKDSQAPELTAAQRENVAVALGVPPSVLDGKSANYATASSEMMGFYLHTILPSAELIAEAFNAQLFERAGLRFEFEPEKLEIMQSAQLEQAQALQDLTGGKPVMTQNEARSWLGLDYMEVAQAREKQAVADEMAEYGLTPVDEPEPVTATPPPQFGQPTAAGSAAQPLEEQDDDEEQMKRWLDVSLGLYRAGSPATAGTPFDAELAGASSANMVKRIYAAHWPRKDEPAQTWQEKALVELARYNRLAEGALSNG